MDKQNDNIQENEDLNLAENNLRLTKKKIVTQKIGVIIGLALGVITVIAILLIVLLGGNNASSNNNQCIHKYVKDTENSVESTCTIRGTLVFKCEKCGDTYNEVSFARGHSWKSATCTEAKYCLLCKITEGSPKGHNWKNATCTTSKKCYYCGITDGEPKPHSWIEATCTEAKKCKSCGAIEGSALGHIWADATCDAPKTCERCQKTEGAALNHNFEKGICTYCFYEDPFYSYQLPTEIIPVGGTWIIDGQWEFTILSATKHYLCNSYANQKNGYSDECLILVKYRYKHLGFNDPIFDELTFCTSLETAFDEDGTASIGIYPCNHIYSYGMDNGLTIEGTTCTSGETFLMPKDCSTINIYVKHPLDETYCEENKLKRYASALFTVTVE